MIDIKHTNTPRLTRSELRIKSGTPESFAGSVWLASDNLMCTPAEARAAIAKYNAEYEAADE